MKRRLLLGRAGTGKTHACLGLLTDALRAGERALLLVPTYSQAEHLRYLLLERSQGLSDNVIHTFESLAEDLTGIRLRGLARPPVRDRVAARALEPGFPDGYQRAGLRAEFLMAVKELKEQGDDPELALANARAHFPEATRGRRLFEAYARYLELSDGIDHEDLLLRARARLKVGAAGRDLLLVDGFHDFTPVQRDIIDMLAAESRETVVTLPLDPDNRTHSIFATAARTAQNLRGYTEEALRTNRRAAGGLAELERRLFTRADDTADGTGIELLVCPTEEDEADRVARLVARSGRPFHDFLLVRRSFRDLEGVYRAAFGRHGIPLRFYVSEPFARSPAARAAAIWLRTLCGEVDLPELLPLLRSPYFLTRPASREVDAFAADLRERRRPEPPECVQPREGQLAALLRAELGVGDALVANPDGDREIARAARLFSLLEEEAQAVADLPLAEGAEVVLRRLPLLKAPVLDRRHDCVYAVEPRDARQWEKPVVIVAGLSADAFPRPVRQDLFLRDDERKRLEEERGLHLPARSHREDEERYLFYVALTRARERVVLTYAAFDEMGTARAPSPYLEEVLTHFENVERRDIPLSEQYVQPRDVVSSADLLPIVADGLTHGVPLAASLYSMDAVPRAMLSRPRRLELARARPLSSPPTAVRLSPSSINSFQRCPYLFLMQRLLRVRRPRVAALDPLTKGSIVHDALEQYALERGDAGAVFDEAFAEATAGMRIGLEEEAQRRGLRAVVLRAAEALDAAPVLEPEKMFKLDIDGVTLSGRIDRIDAYPAGHVIRDYKTGTPKLDAALALEEVQLDAYLLAVENPAGAVYERLRKGDVAGFVVPELENVIRGKDVVVLDRAELDRRRERMRALVGHVAAEVRAGRLAVHPREPERCKRTQCDGYDLCRVQRARWLEKVVR